MVMPRKFGYTGASRVLAVSFLVQSLEIGSGSLTQRAGTPG
jgi:hypothetical protein